MGKSVAFALLLCAGAAAAQNPTQRVTVKASAHEVMYLAHQVNQTSLIAKLQPVQFRWNARNWAADSIVNQFVKSAEKFFATPRPPIRVTLNDLARANSPIDSLIISEINDQGGKSRSLVPVGWFNTLQTLNQTKTYTLTPPLRGYDCSLADLRFADGQWRLFEAGRNQPVEAIECTGKKPPEWIVKVEVSSSRGTEANQELARSIEKAIERLGTTRQPRMRSYSAKERDMTAELAATPQQQRDLAVKTTFVLRASW